MKMKLLLIAIAFAFSNSAYAEIDLIGAITEKTEIVKENGTLKIKFNLWLQNIGDDRAEGSILVKPFLLTEASTLNPYSGTGAVLESKVFEIILDKDQQTLVELEAPLPKLQKANYFLSAVINSSNSIAESKAKRMNNALDMVAVGELESSQVFYRDSAPYDMYAEVMGEITQQWGGLSHRFRTILRKGQTFNSRDMWARFMAADFKTGKVHTLPYSSTNIDIEKNWYAVAWANEKDSERAAIRVDYYSQAPTYDHLLPGDYQFLTLMNSRDTFNDANLADDLTLESVRIEAVKTSHTKEVWFADHGTTSTEQSKEALISFGYTGTDSFLEPVVDNPKIASAEIRPPVAPSTNSTLLIRANAGLPAGEHQTIVRIAAARFPQFSTLVPVKVFVNEGNALANFSNEAQNFESLQGQNSEVKTYRIQNSGTTPLKFSMEAKNKWLRISPTSGEIAPGESFEIQMQAMTFGLRPSTYSSGIHLHLSDRTDSVLIPATYLLKP